MLTKQHRCAGGTAGKTFTIDVTDYVNNVLNGHTDSTTHAAFAVVRLFRRNSEGSGALAYSADSLGSNKRGADPGAALCPPVYPCCA